MAAVVHRAARAEAGTYRSLWLWARHRVDGVGPGDLPFGYASVNSFAVWAFVGVAAVELPLIHFLVPWPVVRWTLLLLGVWTLAWMIGYAGSLHVHPHVAGSAALRVRHGHTIDIPVPWSAITGVRVATRNYLDGAKVQVERSPDGDVLAVTISNQTNVELSLSEPIVVPLRKASGAQVREVRFIADDPHALAAEVRTRLGGAPRP